jgi:DNA polymerase III epsilon subunit-like protein
MTPTDLLQLPARKAPIAVLDLEMTGLDIDQDRVVEVAVVRGDGRQVIGEPWCGRIARCPPRRPR